MSVGSIYPYYTATFDYLHIYFFPMLFDIVPGLLESLACATATSKLPVHSTQQDIAYRSVD